MNQEKKIGKLIEQLMMFGIENGMMDKLDTPLVRNGLMSLMQIAEPYEVEKDKAEALNAEIDDSTPLPILEQLLDLAVEKGFIEDNVTERDLLDAKIMGYLMPRQSELNRMYEAVKAEKGPEAATDFFYKISKDSNYIRMDRISKNMYWTADTEYGDLEITVNLSKPEKDPKEIAKAKLLPQASYPKCLLCLENVGYEGRLNHPGRANHRVLPLTLDHEEWFFQYSPYVYYNEHSIILKKEHEPMKISRKTFVRLLDFVEAVPHYFLGSNADLPIVGGSILTHDHFQGGHYQFPMEVAPIIVTAKDDKYTDVNIGLVKWPLSVIRLSSINKESLVNLADEILGAWREYSDKAIGIHAYSDIDGEMVPHNTITPISRKNREGLYELDLVLRNNRQSEEHPDGIFHPHAHLHHIKKENIGLIEVMGLAVLPARLKKELQDIEDLLTSRMEMEELQPSMEQHMPWIMGLIEEHGTEMSEKAARELIEEEVGKKFACVLECAGVYKMDDAGIDGFRRFLMSLGMEIADSSLLFDAKSV